MRNENEPKIIVFSEYRLEPEAKRLWYLQEEIHLAKRPFQVLQYLIENRERLIGRDELLEKFWDGHEVYDDALRKAVGTIRKALNDLDKPPRFIETRWGEGYHFIGTIEEKNGHQENHSTKLPANETNESSNVLEKPASISLSQPFRYYLAAILSFTLLALIVLGFYTNSSKLNETKIKIQTLGSVRSIAVLPLKNLTGDANNEYFSDGITESVITELSRVQELNVISRSSTFIFKGKDLDPLTLGSKLNVDAFLEGSIQKKGDLLSVNVRLISTKDGRVLWTSQNFERPFEKAYELQDTISCNVAIELKTELCNKFNRRNKPHAEAYQAYLKGLFQFNKRTAEGIKKSIEFYEQAIAIDSNYAPAYAGLAESYVQGIWHVPFEAKDVLPKAKQAALKAIELDNTLAEAYAALANVYEMEWNWAETERSIKRALELNPHFARAHHILAFYYATMGQFDEALAAIKRARELDPLNLVINTDQANLLFMAKKTDEAFRQWEQTLELDPNFAMVYESRGVVNYSLGNETSAIKDFSRAMELDGKYQKEIADFRSITTRGGLKAFYQNELNKLFIKEKNGETVSPYTVAVYFAAVGQKDQAFDYLEKAYKEHNANLIQLQSLVFFEPLRSDPHYKDLKKRMGFPD